jgi:hypothetical protein
MAPNGSRSSKPSALHPSIPPVAGFAASITTAEITDTQIITNWNTPAYSSDPGAFDPLSGTYTVLETGVYKITASVNYVTAEAITHSLGANKYPRFNVRKNGEESIASGLFPLLNVNLTLLTARVILGAGTINFTDTAQLSAGDQLHLYYDADGSLYTLNLGPGVHWSVLKID